MKYRVKEIFYTLQGEGMRSGRAAVFCRFAGCNLWSGREKDLAAAPCYFCDTDFVGIDGTDGGLFVGPEDLALEIERAWQNGSGSSQPNANKEVRYVVFTGGEPLLQLDEMLVQAVKERGFETAVETNGTLACPTGVDWITVSPKVLDSLTIQSGNELKLLFPYSIDPELVANLNFENFYLSPINVADPSQSAENLRLAAEYCMSHPQWRLTIQQHKLVGLR